MLIWPFLAVTFVLFSILSYVVFLVERKVIMKNWDNRRCDLPVMFGASYFKPANDPRSDTEFAGDNMSFCMKQRVSQIMELIMSPFMVIFNGQMGVAGGIGDGLNILRNILNNMKQAFLSFLLPFYQRYVNTAYQVMSITQRMRMAFQKANAIVLALVFSGLTIVRGMINVKDFIIKVVLIILGILVALVIILFFILAPFVGGLILPTIAAISAVAGAGAVGGMADAFCFSPETPIQMADGTLKEIGKLVVGDETKGGGKVTTVIKTTGENVPLFSIGDSGAGAGDVRASNELVSSYHIVWDSGKNTWCFAKDHPRANKTLKMRKELVCISTEKRVFATASGLIARDWEELDDTDVESNRLYEDLVGSLLNAGCSSSTGSPTGSPTASPTPLIDMFALYYKVNGKLVPCVSASASAASAAINIGDELDDDYLKTSEVKGLATTTPEFVWGLKNTKYSKISVQGPPPGQPPVQIIFPLTESGNILLFSKSGRPVIQVKDFTEVGASKLPKTYSFILSRLNENPSAPQQVLS
jgi:hypothetical protein